MIRLLGIVMAVTGGTLFGNQVALLVNLGNPLFIAGIAISAGIWAAGLVIVFTSTSE